MKTLRILALLSCCLILPAFAADKADAPAAPAPAAAAAGKVLVLPLKSEIDQALLYFMRRGFQKAQAEEFSTVIIDMDTPGGRLLETEEIINWIRSTSNAGIKVYTYVNNDAISAGAIIAMACDAIYMAPASRIGDAMPIMAGAGGAQAFPEDLKEKVFSPTRALVRALAQERGYREDMATSMVDPTVEVVIGDEVVCAEGELLTLTTQEAIKIYPPMETPILAQAEAADVDSLLKLLGLEDAKVEEFKPSGSEQIARWITIIAPILMALAMLGIYTEINTPGFGIAGIVGAVCLSICLFGHYIAGMTGSEDIILIVVGLILIGVEVFVLPGFGICGVLGLFAFGAGMVMSMIPLLPKEAPELPGLTPITIMTFLDHALLNTLVTIVITGIGVYILSKILPKTAFYGQLVLQSSASVDAGYIGVDVETRNSYIGMTGITQTALRPAGIATIDGRRVDVVSAGDYIGQGTEIIVKEAQGTRVVVVEHQPDTASEEGSTAS